MNQYLYLSVACLLFSVQFVFTKLFASRSRGDFSAGIWNGAVIAILTVAYLIPVNGLTFAFSASALRYSLLYVGSCFLSTMLNVPAMRRGDLSIVTIYTLLGGMILPFLYGVFRLGENCSGWKIAALLLLTASLLPPFVADMRTERQLKILHPSRRKDALRNKLLFHGICLLLFLCNGLVSIATKAHSIAPDAIDPKAFTMLCSAWQILLLLLSLLVLALKDRAKGDAHPFRHTFLPPVAEGNTRPRTMLLLLVCCLGYAVVHGIADISSQLCAQTMDSSLQFPLLSGAVIVLGALFGKLFFHERISREKLASLLLCTAGIVLFAVA